VVALGVRLLPPAIGAGRPGGAVALALGGPGGGQWTVPAPGDRALAAGLLRAAATLGCD
jgi:hypothetical protein